MNIETIVWYLIMSSSTCVTNQSKSKTVYLFTNTAWSKCVTDYIVQKCLFIYKKLSKWVTNTIMYWWRKSTSSLFSFWYESVFFFIIWLKGNYVSIKSRQIEKSLIGNQKKSIFILISEQHEDEMTNNTQQIIKYMEIQTVPW